MDPKQNISYQSYDDYAQSANTLFHFMKEARFLYTILQKHAIIPRYCVETMDYLHLNNGTRDFTEIAVLQKCFCDIPFHKLAENIPLNGVGEAYESLTEAERIKVEKNNTHFDFYGKYAIAFSKSWGERNHLQPIHYVNKDAQYATNFSKLFEKVLGDDDIPDEYVDDVTNRLAYIKPLRGIMQRNITRTDGSKIDIDIYKNFHDEREWRYVPDTVSLAACDIKSLIANPKKLVLRNQISDQIEDDRYRSIWLSFKYDEIRYLIVPDISSRIELIETILSLENECFEERETIELQKHILISKIIVLDEIRKDW